MTKSRRRVGYYIKTDNGELDFAIHKDDFKQESIEEFKNYTKVVFQIQPILISYDAVVMSYMELLHSIEEHKNKFSEQLAPGQGYIGLVVNCLVESVQKVTNFLSSATSFISCAQVKLKKELGANSDKYISWDDFRKSLHKNNFSYRFLYELRNYSQHSNIPIGKIDVHLYQMLTKTPQVSTTLNIPKSELLNSSFNWNKNLKKEIEKLENKINILPLIEDYMSILKKITFRYLQIYDDQIINCHQYMTTFYRVFQIPDNAVPVIFVGETSSGQPVPTDIVEHIPIDQFQWVLKRYFELRTHN